MIEASTNIDNRAMVEETVPVPSSAASTPVDPPPSRLENFLVRFRVHVGFLIAAGVLIEGLLEKETPMDLRHPTWALAVAGTVVLVGMFTRLIAMGTIRKNEALATRGIYSLCRHPLYLGSALLYIGLGVILNDAHYEFWYLGIPYIAIFYTAAIRKEERFLRAKFGQEFDRFKATTPALLPYGRFQRGEFSWARAWSRGGVKLVVSVALMLVAMQAMVIVFPML